MGQKVQILQMDLVFRSLYQKYVPGILEFEPLLIAVKQSQTTAQSSPPSSPPAEPSTHNTSRAKYHINDIGEFAEALEIVSIPWMTK